MPHITRVERLELETRNVIKIGDACFLFANYANTQFNASPSWTTIHQIRRALKFPFHNIETHALIQRAMGHLDKVDIEIAADLAFIEFYRLVGSKYEDKKIVENSSAFTHPVELCSTECFEDGKALVVPKRGRGRPRKEATNV